MENVSLYFESFSGELPKLTTRLKDHGRIEKREYRLLTDLSWLEEAEDWKGLRAVGMATAQVVKDGKTTADTRYFISSLTDIGKFADVVRKHWSVENQLHWCLDVIFQEDSSRARNGMSPLNLNVLRKVALTLCRNADLGKRVGIQKKRFLASLNPDIFLSVLFGKS